MSVEDAGKVVLFLDLVALLWLSGLAYGDLRQQTSDVGRVGGVVVIAAIVYVMFLVGRAILGL